MLVGEFVAEGLLDPPNANQRGLRAQAGVLRAGRRARRRPAAARAGEAAARRGLRVAERMNANDINNPLAIASFAVYGDYMSRSHHLEELSLGVVVELRAAARPRRFGRMLTKAEGADAIRTASAN